MNKSFDYNNNFSIYTRLFKEVFLPKTPHFIIAIFFMLLSAGSVAYRAYLIKPAIDQVFLNKSSIALIIITIKLIVVAVIIGISTYLENYIMHKTTEDISVNYKEKLFKKLINFDMDYFQNKSSHKILDQFNDISGLMSALNIILTGLIRHFVTIIALTILMLKQNILLSFITFIGFPIIIYPIYYIGTKLRMLASEERELSGQLNSIMGESLSLIKTVKSNNCEDKETKKFEHTLHTAHKLSLKIIRQSLITSPLVEMAASIGFAGVIWYGGSLVMKGSMQTDAFFTFLAGLLSIYKPAKSFAGLDVEMQSAIISAKRLFIVLDKQNLLKEKKDAVDLPNIKGDILFKNVSFGYPFHDKNEPLVTTENSNFKLYEKTAINNINLNIKHGTKTALVGYSGSGKSTIFNLILRFYDPNEGEIFIDDQNIKDITINSLRKNISVITQDTLLFTGTVKDNVKYGTFDATDEEIIEACKKSHADVFIDELEDGYNTIIGSNGYILSAGQKQRILIARAILKNAPILLLNEATSSLDPISENLIQKALNNLMKDKTTIIIAHNLETIQNCDNIFVLEEGNIVEYGKHAELLKKNGVYANLYKNQFEKIM